MQTLSKSSSPFSGKNLPSNLESHQKNPSASPNTNKSLPSSAKLDSSPTTLNSKIPARTTFERKRVEKRDAVEPKRNSSVETHAFTRGIASHCFCFQRGGGRTRYTRKKGRGFEPLLPLFAVPELEGLENTRSTMIWRKFSPIFDEGCKFRTGAARV